MSDPSKFDLDGHPVLADAVARLVEDGGDSLHSVVLYGATAHGEAYADREYNLMVVLADLELATLAKVADATRRWRRKGQPMPRFFSPELLEQAADVFPIEFLDIRAHHVLLHGDDLLADLVVEKDHLRLQCERELREKMMRLREAYLEATGSDRKLKRLLTESYPAFVAIFRGCLRLDDAGVPTHNADVVAAFCRQADLDPEPFEAIEALERGQRQRQRDQANGDFADLLTRYYTQLTRAVRAIDLFSPDSRGNQP